MSIPALVDPAPGLSEAERVRAARHLSLAPMGELGQRRLAAARVAIIGAGGLGSPTILALAAAGVGTLVVIDDDVVETSNLQRQIIHRGTDVGARKTLSAARVAADLAPETTVIAVNERLTAGNAWELLAGVHLVIDGSDTFETRSAVAAATEDLGVPLVWGAVQEFDAQVTVFWSAPPPGHKPVRLGDLYPPGQIAPSCAEVGVLGALCLQVGALLATEAIKLITGIGEPLLGRLLLIDSRRARQTEIAIGPSRARSTPEPEPTPTAPEQLSPVQLLDAAAAGAVLLDVREPRETAAGIVPGSVLIPLAALLADPSTAGPGPFLVVCQHGIRAQRAAAALIANGQDATVLAGGYAAWAGIA